MSEHPNRIRLTACLIAFLLLGPGLPAVAQDNEESVRELSVEVIVFRRSGDSGHDEERWPDNPGIPPISEALVPDSEDADDAGLRQASQHRLERVLERLENEGDFEVLLHRHWIQPERERGESRALRLSLDERPLPEEDGGMDEEEQRQSVFQDEHLQAPTRDRLADPLEAGTRMELARPLDGTVHVYRNRYFHVAADLVFNPAVDEESLSAEDRAAERAQRIEDLLAGRISFQEYQSAHEDETAAFPGYRLNESRRVRLGQLHYLDHPRFGVIVRVDRVDD